eukprot:Hpha_TRINITY_DN91_c0_g1::TRINITY_DN91_c0_g1_i1::g.110006::m.110006
MARPLDVLCDTLREGLQSCPKSGVSATLSWNPLRPGGDLSEADIDQLFTTLQTHGNVSRLSFQGRRLPLTSVISLGEWVRRVRSVRGLDLSFSRIGGSAAAQIVAALTTKGSTGGRSKVTALNLSGCGIGVSVMGRIGRCLESVSCSLRCLRLRYNPITGQGLGLLLKWAIGLQEIDCRWCGILCSSLPGRESGLNFILEGLRENTACSTLLLQGNGFKEDDRDQVLECIAGNKRSSLTIHTIVFSDSQTESKGPQLRYLPGYMTEQDAEGTRQALEEGLTSDGFCNGLPSMWMTGEDHEVTDAELAGIVPDVEILEDAAPGSLPSGVGSSQGRSTPGPGRGKDALSPGDDATSRPASAQPTPTQEFDAPSGNAGRGGRDPDPLEANSGSTCVSGIVANSSSTSGTKPASGATLPLVPARSHQDHDDFSASIPTPEVVPKDGYHPRVAASSAAWQKLLSESNAAAQHDDARQQQHSPAGTGLSTTAAELRSSESLTASPESSPGGRSPPPSFPKEAESRAQASVLEVNSDGFMRRRRLDTPAGDRVTPEPTLVAAADPRPEQPAPPRRTPESQISEWGAERFEPSSGGRASDDPPVSQPPPSSQPTAPSRTHPPEPERADRAAPKEAHSHAGYRERERDLPPLRAERDPPTRAERERELPVRAERDREPPVRAEREREPPVRAALGSPQLATRGVYNTPGGSSGTRGRPVPSRSTPTRSAATAQEGSGPSKLDLTTPAMLNACMAGDAACKELLGDAAFAALPPESGGRHGVPPLLIPCCGLPTILNHMRPGSEERVAGVAKLLWVLTNAARRPGGTAEEIRAYASEVMERGKDTVFSTLRQKSEFEITRRDENRRARYLLKLYKHEATAAPVNPSELPSAAPHCARHTFISASRRRTRSAPGRPDPGARRPMRVEEEQHPGYGDGDSEFARTERSWRPESVSSSTMRSRARTPTRQHRAWVPAGGGNNALAQTQTFGAPTRLTPGRTRTVSTEVPQRNAYVDRGGGERGGHNLYYDDRSSLRRRAQSMSGMATRRSGGFDSRGRRGSLGESEGNYSRPATRNVSSNLRASPARGQHYR